MKNQIALIGIYALIHLAFTVWTEKSKLGRGLKHYLQNWKTDSFFHLCLCGGSVFILSCCAILALGLTFKILGI